MQWAEISTVTEPILRTWDLPDLRGHGTLGITEDPLPTFESMRLRRRLETVRRAIARGDSSLPNV